MNKRPLPQTGWHLLLITLFGLPLISPLLRWTAVPCTHDGHLHYHRIAAMRYAWENGLFFTRWLPDLAFGYGYPFFIFREPVPLYAGLLPHLLGLPLPAAENLIYILAILAGGWFMYLWVRDVLGARAGIVSAVAYMAAPYVLIDALIRGNAPESVALPLFPLLLWLGRRWLLEGTAVSFILSVLSLALLALSHNISLLLFTPTLLLYLLFIGWQRRLKWPTVAGRILLLFGLGLGMTAFYSGGALLEMGQVSLQQSTTTRNNDFHYNFASLGEILAPAPPEDPALINPPLPFRLGWVPAALAILGLSSLFWRKKADDSGLKMDDSRLKIGAPQSSILNHPSSIINREQHGHILLMALAAAVFLLLALPTSLPIWENVPLIDFLQFPWRMIGRAALPIAFLAGVPFARSSARKAARFPFSVFHFPFYVALILLILEALPSLYPATCKENPFPTINAVHAYERETGLVGVDPEGSYFPRTVQRRPKESPLEADFAAGQMPQRFDTAVLPPNAAILTPDYQPLAATVRLNSPEPFTARYLSFAFPGWTAEVDGRSVPITPSDPGGLITFPVPAGEHTITVRWQSTLLRTALLGVSIMMLAAFVVTAVVLAGRASSVNRKPLSVIRKPLSVIRKPSPDYQLPITNYQLPITNYQLLLTALLLIAIKFLVVDRVETPLRRAGTPLVGNTAVLQAAELRFEGYNLSRTSVPSGATFDINMAWTAVAPPQADYQTNVWLVGPDGLIWSEKGTERPRLYEDAPPTRQWLPGQWAWDSREVQLFSGTPPGQYDIILTLFDKADLQPLTLLDASGAVAGPTAVIGQIEVTRPDEPAEFEPQFAAPAAAGTAVAGLTLLGYNQDRDEAAPGDPVLLTFFWEKPARPPGASSNFQLHLQDENGTIRQTWEISPTRANYPPADWAPGDRWRGQHALRLPAALDSGAYQFLLNSLPLGQITIHAPDRAFAPPAIETPVNIPFADATGAPQAILTGYTQLPITNYQLPITFLWKAQTKLPISYRVFVHLVDERGNILAQSDGEPANWSRPTTGWAAGEYISDPHTLTLPGPLPDGPLALRVGLYDPATGQRLRTPTADFAELMIDN